jgi:hypothetical protein
MWSPGDADELGIRGYATPAPTPKPDEGRRTLVKSALTGVAFGFGVAFVRDVYNRSTSGPDVRPNQQPFSSGWS